MNHQKRGRGTAALFMLAVFAGGFVTAAVIAKIAGVRFGFRLWPLVACVDVFAYATIGFFQTTGKIEVFYGVCSIAAAVCCIVQMAILF